MTARSIAAALAASAALLLSVTRPGELAAQNLAIVGATVYPVSGPPIEGATVLVRDGLIAAVGTDVPVPVDDFAVFDAEGKVVTPGFFDAGTQIGLVEIGLESTTVDSRVEGDPVSAAFDVVDGLNPNSTLIPINRLGGVTTTAALPTGGLIAGQGAVIDLTGETVEEMLVKPRAAMVASFGPGAAAATGGARGAASLRLREVLEDARYWASHREAYDRGEVRPLSVSRLDLEALQPVLAGEIPLVVQVDRASDILAVLRIAEEYGVRPVIRRGTEAWMVAEQLAERSVPVIVKPLTSLPDGFDRLGARFDNAAILHEAGVAVAVSSFQSHRAHNIGLEAGNAIRFGLPWEAALRAVTLTPAEIYGVADRYGSIEAGKVGNLVVWSGDPFELSSRAEEVIIRGVRVPRESRQLELLERYRTLDGGHPPAYRGDGDGGSGGS
jgi:imidazolonepropionase-like amidohydrolase